LGNQKERDHMEALGIDGRIMLKWILKKYDRRAWTGLLWLKWQALVNMVMILWT
jgi:hypothetical protein